MHIDKIHPELRKTVKRIPSITIYNRFVLFIIRLLFKLAPKAKPVAGVTVTEQALKNSQVRIHRPEGTASGAGLLWIHGGGYIVGSTPADEKTCSQYAKALNIVVVSVEYRLAPEHPFPCATDDCFEAWQWFQNNAQSLEVDPTRIAISGQSAGGGLAASLVQRIFDHGRTQPAAQLLFYPMLDDRTATQQELDDVRHRPWNNRSNRNGWTWYLSQTPGTPTLPEYASPARRKDVSGLPPTWIGVGDVDLFYAENCEYAARLDTAGVPCQLDIAPGAPHGFDVFAAQAPVTVDFLAKNDRFLRNALGL